MLIRPKKVEEIVKGLALLQYYIKANNKLSKYDVNKDCEDFFCGLFNIVYGLELSNMNKIQVNYPSIDLGSITDSIAVQITSSTSKKKVNHTIEGFEGKKLYKDYKKMWIFTLFEKKNFEDIEYKESKYELILMDMYDLLKTVSDSHDVVIDSVLDYLSRNLDYCINYFAGITELGKGEVKKATSYENFMKFIFSADSLEEVNPKNIKGFKAYIKEIELLGGDLQQLNRITRECLALCINYSLSEYRRDDNLVFNWNEVSSNVKEPKKLLDQVEILHDRRFVDYDAYDSPYILIRREGFDSEVLYDLYCYCNYRKIDIKNIVVNLDFSLLD